ncbi:unnamed protein product [Symbiodinium natans]|uniref:Uncharacterized protein n=1 Tax=Symbiodinium natans TaxID=878477 RepID=A0A812L7S6_9DINO|nr:unnamed protein product [Symbiodinium natans]
MLAVTSLAHKAGSFAWPVSQSQVAQTADLWDCSLCSWCFPSPPQPRQTVDALDRAKQCAATNAETEQHPVCKLGTVAARDVRSMPLNMERCTTGSCVDATISASGCSMHTGRMFGTLRVACRDQRSNP